MFTHLRHCLEGDKGLEKVILHLPTCLDVTSEIKIHFGDLGIVKYIDSNPVVLSQVPADM